MSTISKAAAIFISLYILSYSLLSIWLIFDGWLNQFSSLYPIWNITNETLFTNTIKNTLFTALGAILGGAILNITSFHKYFAIEQNFDIYHLWGFIFTPILSAIVGIIIYALIQSGILVLSGSMSTTETSTASLGYTAIGSIAGYNWDVFIKKIQELSNILQQKNNINSK